MIKQYVTNQTRKIFNDILIFSRIWNLTHLQKCYFLITLFFWNIKFKNFKNQLWNSYRYQKTNFKAFFKGCCNHIGWWFSNRSIFWYHLIWQGECSKILSLTFNQSSSSSSALYNNCLCKSSSFKRVFFLKKKLLSFQSIRDNSI